jgi:hypothetical protein
MSRVQVLVDKLRLDAPTDETYNQTAVISTLSYHRLSVLAEYLNMSRSRLSGMLLIAAIDEAIDALPDDETIELVPGDERSAMSATEYLLHEAMGRYIAEDLDARDPVLAIADSRRKRGKSRLLDIAATVSDVSQNDRTPEVK